MNTAAIEPHRETATVVCGRISSLLVGIISIGVITLSGRGPAIFIIREHSVTIIVRVYLNRLDRESSVSR
jgi:hypothetical protein